MEMGENGAFEQLDKTYDAASAPQDLNDEPISPSTVTLLGLARHGQLSMLTKWLAKLDASKRHQQLRAQDELGNTALLLAITHENPNCASLLLQFKETDPMHTNSMGDTALSLAARSKRPFVVRAVLHRLLSVDRLERGELVTCRGLSRILGSDGAVSLALARHDLVDLLAELSLDALARCAVRAFKRLPACCLYDCVELAAAIQLRSRDVQACDAFRADELEAASAQLQLAAAGCLASLGRLKDGLGRFEVDELLQSPLGEAAIKLAIRHSCKHFLAQPPVQALLTREWRGPLFDAVVEDTDAHFGRQAGRCLAWLLAAAANLLLLPLFAACPPLESHLVDRLKQHAAARRVASHLPEGFFAHCVVGSHDTATTSVASAQSRARPPSPPLGLHGQRDGRRQPNALTARPLLHFYLLRVPMLKFALRLVSDVALALCVTFSEGEPSPWVFLVWPLGGLLSEYLQLIATDSDTPTLYASLKNEVLSWVRSDTPSTYRDDLFNVVDMLALHLLLASQIAYHVARDAHLPLRAFAVLALYVRLLRLIYLSPKLGALVLLLVRMTTDLLKLFALYVVEGSWVDDEHDRALRTPACDDFYILGGSWRHWGKLLFLVLNAVVDGRAQDALFMCVLHEANTNRYLLWLFTYLLLLFVVVLLLNMLIAMFSRSFDMMYDSMTIHVQTHFARAVVAWCANAPEPPPLTLLQLPYLSFSVLSAFCRSCRPRRAPNGEALSPQAAASSSLPLETAADTASAAGLSPTIAPSPAASAVEHPEAVGETASLPASLASTRAEAVSGASVSSAPISVGSFRTIRPPRSGSASGPESGDTFSGMGLQPAVQWLLSAYLVRHQPRGARDYAGTTVPSAVGPRNSWEIWKEKMSEESLTLAVANFVAKREDTLSQEERWRNKMMRRLGDKFDAVDARLDGLSERFEQLASVCAEIQEGVRGMRPASE